MRLENGEKPKAVRLLESLSHLSHQNEVYEGPLPPGERQGVMDPLTGELISLDSRHNLRGPRDPYEYSDYPLTKFQRRQIERQWQKDLVKSFKEMNPHVLQRFRTALNEGQWSTLMGMIARGAFWAAATYALHIYLGPLWYLNPLAIVGVSRAILTHKDRQDVKRLMGIKKGRWFHLIDRSYQGSKKSQEKEQAKLAKIADKRPQLSTAVTRYDPFSY